MRENKIIKCEECGKDFHFMGYMNHVAGHRRKEDIDVSNVDMDFEKTEVCCNFCKRTWKDLETDQLRWITNYKYWGIHVCSHWKCVKKFATLKKTEIEPEDFRVDSSGWETLINNNGEAYKVNLTKDIMEIMEGPFVGRQLFKIGAAIRETRKVGKKLPTWKQWRYLKDLALYFERIKLSGPGYCVIDPKLGMEGSGRSGYYWCSSNADIDKKRKRDCYSVSFDEWNCSTRGLPASLFKHLFISVRCLSETTKKSRIDSLTLGELFDQVAGYELSRGGERLFMDAEPTLRRIVHIPKILQSIASKKATVGHRFMKYAGYYYSEEEAIMIRGDFRKVMNDDQKKWIVKTLFHEIGHYVSLGLLPNREIMLNYIDFVYPKKSRMMASDIPRIISYLSDTNWEEYFNETVRKKKIKYFDFYGFEPYFPPSENYKIVNGDREHSNLVGMGKVTRNFRYRRDGDNFISEYAKTNTREDFAEHFAEYIIDPENLKKRAPVKYEYFEKLFSGNEFRPVQGDQKIFSESHSILQKCEFPVEGGYDDIVIDDIDFPFSVQ